MNRFSYRSSGPDLLLIILTACLMAYSGCASYRVQIPQNSIKPGQFGDLEVLTFDGAIFSLKEARITPTAIAGYGWKFSDELTQVPFEGEYSI